MKAFLPVLALFPAVVFAQRQEKPVILSRMNIAANIAPLASGSPELQFDYFVHRNVGIVAATGVTFYPVRGAVKLGDNVDMQSLWGSYWKLGLKGRYQAKGPKGSSAWLQLLYVGSQYREKATVNNIPAERSGTVHGYAAAVGADIYLRPRLDLRLGLQIGFYNRTDHLSEAVMTFQPGFGRESIFPTPSQLHLGLSYRIGSIKPGITANSQ